MLTLWCPGVKFDVPTRRAVDGVCGDVPPCPISIRSAAVSVAAHVFALAPQCDLLQLRRPDVLGRFQRLSRLVMPRVCVSAHLPLVRLGAGALEEDFVLAQSAMTPFPAPY